MEELKRRGSVALIALIMVVATAAVALAMVSLSGSVRTKQIRLQDRRMVQDAFDGGVDYVHDMAERGVLRLPQTVNLTVGNVQESLALTDVSSVAVSLLGVSVTVGTPSISINGTLTYRGETYRMQQIIGRGLLSTVWQYAIYDDSSISTLSTVSTGSSGYQGDAWFNGSVTLLNGSSHIRGNLTSTGLIVDLGAVDGVETTNSPSITFPNPSNSTYSAAATVSLPNNSVIHGYSFSAATATGYPLIYCSGAATISGNFTGSGVIFVDGAVTIDGNIATSVGSHLVIIGNANVSLSSSATSLYAYIYCGGTFSTGNAGTTRSIIGGLVASKITLVDGLSSSFDSLVVSNPSEAYNLKLPGVWP